MLTVLSLPSPFGPLRLVGTDAGLTHLLFPGQAPPEGAAERESPLLRQAALELEEYFNRMRIRFTVPLCPTGSPFQLAVWSALQDIPYGQTASYRDIAVRIGRPAAARAVGQANGANPLPIFIPCHRVIASDGSLGGYAFGLEVKRALLKLEGAPLSGKLILVSETRQTIAGEL